MPRRLPLESFSPTTRRRPPPERTVDFSVQTVGKVWELRQVIGATSLVQGVTLFFVNGGGPLSSTSGGGGGTSEGGSFPEAESRREAERAAHRQLEIFPRMRGS
jgi:hypothetical protein